MANSTSLRVLWPLLRAWIALRLVLAIMRTLIDIFIPSASGVGLAMDRASHVVWAMYAFRRLQIYR